MYGSSGGGGGGVYAADAYGQAETADWFGELVAAPVCADPRFQEPVTVVQFDQQHEALWAGTESGMLSTLQCPMLSRFASWPCHPSAVLDLQLLSDCAISVSGSRVALTASGGFTHAAANLSPEENDSWVSSVVEPGTGSSRLLIAGSSGHVYTHDLIANRVTKQQGSAAASDGLVLLRGPVGHRGAVAAATGGGRVLLLDSRAGWQPSSAVLAHVGGISSMELQGDMVATAGYSRRMGQVVPDSTIRVFDCRAALRPLFTLPASGAAVLAWHPVDAMTLMAASPEGLLVFADPSNPTALSSYQVDTAGDALRCAAISPSGEAVALGGSGGYVHLWASSAQPRIAAHSRLVSRLVHPPAKEHGPFTAPPGPHMLLLAAAMANGAASAAGAAAAAAASTRLLSDVPEFTFSTVGRPPRVVDPALVKDLNQVDFVGYIPNPHYSRAKAPGAARKAALPLQHTRLKIEEDKGDADAARAARVQSRLAEGGLLLPQRYRRLVIRAQSSVRFEEFDFSYYNKTRFAGLENDLPNCYCNALLQVLYFTPAFREAVLEHRPEPALEFCLTCELLFLFKMLLGAAGGQPCQALNLLRALKQNREAAALGLLEGTLGAGGAGAGAAGAGVLAAAGDGGGGAAAGAAGGGAGSAAAEWGGRAAQLAVRSALPKRVAALCRFLLDLLYKEAGGDTAATAYRSRTGGGGSGGGSSSSGGRASDADGPVAGAAEGGAADAGDQQAADEGGGLQARQEPGSGSDGGGRDAAAELPAGAAARRTGAQANGAGPGSGAQGKDGAGEACEAADSEVQRQHLAAALQDLFGLSYRSDMAALSGPSKGATKSRQLTTFQVDLQYPPTGKDGGGGGSSRPGGGAAAPSPGPSVAASPVKGGAAVAESPGRSGASCPPSPLPPLSPSPGGRRTDAAAAGMPCLSLDGGAADRPAFGSLLASSLRSESVTKAWFDESCGYAYVKQSRVPLALPKVLVVNCAITSPGQAALWAPAKGGAAADASAGMDARRSSGDGGGGGGGGGGGTSAPGSGERGGGPSAAGDGRGHGSEEGAPWLPLVIQVRSNPQDASVDVLTAETLDELEGQASGAPPAPVLETYELTGLICHIVDEDEGEQSLAAAGGAAGGAAGLLAASPSARGAAGAAAYQGHAVALIRVQPPYLDPELGGLSRLPSSVAHLAHQGSGIARRFSSGGGGGGGVPAAPDAAGGRANGASAGGSAAAGAAGHAAASGFSLPDSLDDVFAELSISPGGGEEGGGSSRSSGAGAGEGEGEDGGEDGGEGEGATQDEAADGAGRPPAEASAQQEGGADAAQQHLQHHDHQGGGHGAGGGAGQQWVVINDFSIAPIPPWEVRDWYKGQKLPCLLQYTQVDELQRAKELPPPEPPSPVDGAMFEALCAAPPLQGPGWRGRRTFTPLEFPLEAPRPGLLVAIDAEFVAVSRAETSFEGGVEVQVKPSRLALARVSVLRGSGPSAGTAFIDDYVASVEPVADYLTRWSGIRPGDLDPGSSPHHLVSLKTANLKLHHLLDAGCVFVGHGLKQDFRMLNITVPPEQVRDTVELFSFRRQRKLSLRFLASYLLGLTIQQGAGAAGAAAASAAAAAAAGGGAGATAKDGGAGASAAGGRGGKGRAPAAVPPKGGAGAAAQQGPSGGHDSIEDAATALVLYNVYCKLQEEGKLEEKLHEIYCWGKQYGWEPVVHVNGAPQPPLAAPPAGVFAGAGAAP